MLRNWKKQQEMTVSASAVWLSGLKIKSNAFWLFWVISQNTTEEVAILDLTATTQEELLYNTEEGGTFEDSVDDLLGLFLIHFTTFLDSENSREYSTECEKYSFSFIIILH